MAALCISRSQITYDLLETLTHTHTHTHTHAHILLDFYSYITAIFTA